MKIVVIIFLRVGLTVTQTSRNVTRVEAPEIVVARVQIDILRIIGMYVCSK